jgi:hypothetical protein
VPQVTCFEFVLIYAISTGAGDQAYILVKRCSEMLNNIFFCSLFEEENLRNWERKRWKGI